MFTVEQAIAELKANGWARTYTEYGSRLSVNSHINVCPSSKHENCPYPHTHQREVTDLKGNKLVEVWRLIDIDEL